MTALTHKENDLHNRLIVAEFNLGQVEKELRRLHKENKTLRARLATEQDEGHCQACNGGSCTAKEGCVALDNPPQREWQGLTENEIKHFWYEACQTNLELTSQLIVHLARNIEAKLKERNT